MSPVNNNFIDAMYNTVSTMDAASVLYFHSRTHEYFTYWIKSEKFATLRKNIQILAACHCIGYICIGYGVIQLYRHICIAYRRYKRTDTTILH